MSTICADGKITKVKKIWILPPKIQILLPIIHNVIFLKRQMHLTTQSSWLQTLDENKLNTIENSI